MKIKQLNRREPRMWEEFMKVTTVNSRRTIWEAQNKFVDVIWATNRMINSYRQPLENVPR